MKHSKKLSTVSSLIRPPGRPVEPQANHHASGFHRPPGQITSFPVKDWPSPSDQLEISLDTAFRASSSKSQSNADYPLQSEIGTNF